MKQKIIFENELCKKDIIDKIDKLITVEAENNWVNHFKYILKYFGNGNNENILGQTNNDSFIIWQYNFIWGGIFYPIIFGNLITQNGLTVLEIKTKLNICGKLLSIIIFIGMMFAFIYNNFYVTNGDIHFNI